MDRDYSNDLYYIADQIRRMRESKGWSQEEFADRADISRSTLYRIETGNAFPIDVLLRILDIGEISAESGCMAGKGSQYPRHRRRGGRPDHHDGADERLPEGHLRKPARSYGFCPDRRAVLCLQPHRPDPGFHSAGRLPG